MFTLYEMEVEEERKTFLCNSWIQEQIMLKGRVIVNDREVWQRERSFIKFNVCM